MSVNGILPKLLSFMARGHSRIANIFKVARVMHLRYRHNLRFGSNIIYIITVH